MNSFSSLLLDRPASVHQVLKIVTVSQSQDPCSWTPPRAAAAPAPQQLQQRRRMNGLSARVCSIQDPQPSFVSATRGHRDATWRPGAMDADWDEVSRSPRPFLVHPSVSPAAVQSLRAGTESCATRQTPRSLGVADCELWTKDCGLRAGYLRKDERLQKC